MKNFLFLALMLMASMTFANPIGRQQAMQNASAFLNKRQKTKGKLNMKLVHQRLFNPQKPVNTDDDTALYIFNVGTDEGFIITSGDDATQQILGYSEKGHFNPDSIPDNMKSWMDGRIEEMAWLKKHAKGNTGNNTSQTTARNRINPLLETKWHQDKPYNLTLPYYSKLKYYYTGCIATAMAQVMYYFKWPAATKERIEGYTTTDDGNEIKLDGIPAGTPIDWELMKQSYSSWDLIFNNAAMKAVAELMRYCATAIKSEFTKEATTAYMKDAAEALIKKFGYHPDVKEVFRSKYNLNKWLELIYDELKKGRPVIYIGYPSASSIGHAFIVDGYDGDERHHINWGWVVDYDGYYLLTLANPFEKDQTGSGSTEYSYSLNQSAIINIMPENWNPDEKKHTGLTFEEPSIDGNTIFYDILNLSGATNNFEYTIATLDDDGTLTPIGEIKTVHDMENNNKISKASFTVKGLSDGTYKIVPVSREIDTKEWIYNTSGTNEEYVEAHVIGGHITLYLRHPSSRLEVTDISFPGSLKTAETQPVKVIISNLGDEYYGEIYLFASTTDNKGKANGPFGISVTKGGRVETTLSFTPQSDGLYHIWVTTDSEGKQVIGQSNVTIKANKDTGLKLTMTIKNLDNEQKHLLGNIIETKINYKNPTSDNYSDQIGIRVYCYKDDGETILSNGKETKINAGASGMTDISLEIDENTLQQGYKEFTIVPFYVSEDRIVEIEGYKDTRYTIVPALTYYTGEGEKKTRTADGKLTVTDDMAAVDLRGNTSITEIVVENTNCLFITDSKNIPVQGLENNVIIDGVAEEVSLHDGYPFYSPVDFVAKKISYTRVFDKGTRGRGGWDTIVLPFEVRKVSVEKNGKEFQIDWFHNESDYMKNFWVKEFSGDSRNTMFFSYTQEMAALRPYIITVPGDSWGKENDLTRKPVTFHGEYANVSSDNTAATTGDLFKMKGVFMKTPLEDVYYLNEEGTYFTKGDTTVLPFRAYFMNTITGPISNEATLNIGTMDMDRIDMLEAETTPDWYTITGLRIDKPTKSGIYINKGKIIVIK